jgi:hypothetical protein
MDETRTKREIHWRDLTEKETREIVASWSSEATVVALARRFTVPASRLREVWSAAGLGHRGRETMSQSTQRARERRAGKAPKTRRCMDCGREGLTRYGLGRAHRMGWVCQDRTACREAVAAAKNERGAA